jgi:hypothetical protein
MPDPAVTALTGYKGGDDSSGKGGRTREATVMNAVDDAVTGGPAHPAATPSNPVNTRPPATPSSYAPSDSPTPGPRVYGSPIEGNAASK